MLVAQSIDYPYLEQRLQNLLSNRLEAVLAQSSLTGKLREAALYSVLPPGKCIRPFLALMLCRDLGGDELSLVDVALSLELVHCASLIHDDLPALDNDDERRGRPSCHRVFGEATALLAGDALYSLAIQNIADGKYSDRQKLLFIQALADGYTAVVNGQQLDLDGAGNEEELESIAFQKTGALFAAAAKFGVIGASARIDLLPLTRRFGLWLGLYFQIADDYIDVFGSELERGRRESSDSKKEKFTFFIGGDAEQAEESLSNAENQVRSILDIIARTDQTAGLPMDGTRYVLAKIFGRTDTRKSR